MDTMLALMSSHCDENFGSRFSFITYLIFSAKFTYLIIENINIYSQKRERNKIMKKIMIRVLVAILLVFSILGIGCYVDSKKESKELKVTDSYSYVTEDGGLVVGGYVSFDE